MVMGPGKGTNFKGANFKGANFKGAIVLLLVQG